MKHPLELKLEAHLDLHLLGVEVSVDQLHSGVVAELVALFQLLEEEDHHLQVVRQKRVPAG